MQAPEVYSVSAGIVTKIGYPYDPRHPIKGKLRYVEVQDGDGMRSQLLLCVAAR